MQAVRLGSNTAEISQLSNYKRPRPIPHQFSQSRHARKIRIRSDTGSGRKKRFIWLGGILIVLVTIGGIARKLYPQSFPPGFSTTKNEIKDQHPQLGASGQRQPFRQGKVKWQLLKTDNFDGQTLNDELWEYGWFRFQGKGKYDAPVNDSETACYSTDQVTIRNGELNLSLRPTTEEENSKDVCKRKNGEPAYFVSGYVTTRSRLQIQPGTYIEARMFIPGELNILYNWPALWTTDMDKTLGGPWPYTGEFDILEVLKGEPCGDYHFATSIDGKHQQAGKKCSNIPANTWVIFAMKWNYDGTVEYFHAGEKIKDFFGQPWTIDTKQLAGKVSSNYSHNIAIQYGMHGDHRAGYKTPTISDPLILKVDYIDVYKLPKE